MYYLTMIEKIKVMMERSKVAIENMKISPVEWLITFSGILMIRFFFESLSSPSSSGIVASDAPTLIHYYLFFLSVSLALMLVLQYAVPTWKKIIPTVTLFALTLITVPPVIDWIVSGGKGFSMAYLFQTPSEMVLSFLTFFGLSLKTGITVGIRVELALMLIGVGWFVYLVSKSLKRSSLTVLALYIVMFVAVSVPGIITTISNTFTASHATSHEFLQNTITSSQTLANNIHGTLRYSSLERLLEIGFDFMIARIWFIVTIVLASVWFLTNFKQQTIATIKNSRLERTAHYIFLIILGIFVAYHQVHFSLNWNDYLALITLFLAFYFSWMFAVSMNDIYDVDIDQVSNQSRPIPEGVMNISDTKASALIFLLLSLVGGYLAGYYAFFCVLAFTALYYIYSIPPLRLKRAPVLSVVIIGFCSLIAVIAGFFTVSTFKEISVFPAGLLAGIVIMFSLLPQTKDIKDIEGDSAAGIKTLATIFGSIWGPRVVGGLAGIAYLVVPFVANNMAVFIGAIPAAGVTYWISTKKPYTERPIFIVYGLFVVFLAIILLRP